MTFTSGPTPASALYDSQQMMDSIWQKFIELEVEFAVLAGVPLQSYTVAGVPVADTPGLLIYVSDEAGGSVPAFSDGTNWRRVTDRTIIA